jgi:Fe-S cluster assembly ATPase SufC
MSDALVNREPEVRRVQDEIVFAGRDAFRLELHHRLLAGLRGFLHPIVIPHVFVAHPLRTAERVARLKITRRSVHRRDREIRHAANEVLFDARAIG